MEAEAAHGTVTRHYREHQKGKRDLHQPDRLDLRLDARPLVPRQVRQHAAGADASPETLEKVCVDTVEAGSMTKDLALLISPDQTWMTTRQFLDKLSDNLKKAMSA